MWWKLPTAHKSIGTYILQPETSAGAITILYWKTIALYWPSSTLEPSFVLSVLYRMGCSLSLLIIEALGDFVTYAVLILLY